MTIRPVNLVLKDSQSQNSKKQSTSAPSFKGLGDINPVIAMMDGIEKGGFAASFVIQDMLGMALPRTAAGLSRNSKDTGEKNTAYAKLVAIREILSGPSSFIIPAVILAGVKKHFGRANDVPINYIKGFSDNFIEVTNNNVVDMSSPKSIKEAFYRSSVKNILESSTTNLSADEIATHSKFFADKLLEVDSAPKKYFWSPSKDKSGNVINYAKDLKGEFVENFTEFKKAHCNSPSNRIFHASYKVKNNILNVSEDKVVTTKIGNLVNYLLDYTNDVSSYCENKFKAQGHSIKDFIDNFANKRVGSRFLTNMGMMAAVISFFTIIPKLYNSKDGKNPALAGLTPEGCARKGGK